MARKIQVEIVGDASSLNRAFKQAEKSGSRFGSAMKTAAKAAGVGLAVGVGLAAVAMKKSFDAAVEAEKAQTKLDTAFKATGATAKQHTEAMAAVSKVSREAALDDEDLMDSLSSLTRVTGDATKAQEAMGVAADIARGRGIELSAATGIVQKAMLGNLGALKRIGIEIPKVTTAQDALKESNVKATAEQIKAAKAADETATRQGALAALQKNYAGASEAYGNTAAGAQDRFRVAVENLQEALGQKLLPVFAAVAEWVTNNMPTIESTVKTVTDNIGAAFSALADVAEKAWPRIKKAAENVGNWYRDNLEPTITSVTKNISSAWDRAGVDSKESAARNFGGIPPLIKMLMQNTLSIVNATLALLRGDWGEAWNQVKVIPGRALQAVLDTLRIFKGAADAAAKAIGDAVVSGVKAGLGPLIAAVTGKLSGVASAIADVAGNAYGWAKTVGASIISGVVDGLSGLGAAVKAKAESMLHSALSNLNPFSSVEHGGRIHIGEPIVRGAILGLESMSSHFNAKTTDVVKRAVDAAADAVRGGQSEFKDAWSSYSSAALAAFDDVAGKVKTKSEQALAKMQADRAKADISRGVGDARAGLAEARAAAGGIVAGEGETPEALAARQKEASDAVIAAQRTLDEALYRQKEFGLQRRAELERTKLDAQTEVNRIRFQKWLASRNAQQQVELATEGKGQAAIVEKIRSYNSAYRQRGLALGQNLAIGLRDSAGGVVDAANELAAAIAKALGVASEVGKNAAVTTGDRLTEVGKRAGGGPVRAGTPYIVGEQGPEIFWPGMSGNVMPNSATQSVAGGGGGSVVFNFPNYVGNRDELIAEVREGLLRAGRYNSGGVLGGLA